jgi:hypothetical protein
VPWQTSGLISAHVQAANVSETRRRNAIESTRKRAGMVVVDWHYDAGVSGADPVESRAASQAC